jgi:hypothetical protein
MSRTGLSAVVLGFTIAAGGASAAAPCGNLGLQNAYLTQFYCAQLTDLADRPPVTRGLQDGSQPDEDATAPAPWGEIPIIRDAYRADPRKTLALIERIRNAGGLPDK